MNVYDFDNTIYDGDSSVDFFKYCIKKDKRCLLVLPKLFFVLCLYLIKVLEKEQLKSCFFSIVKWFDNTDEIVEKFWIDNEYKLKKFYIKQKRKSDVIISASPEFLLNPIAIKYNFKLIASKVDKTTGKLLEKNCYGEEKVRRLKAEKVSTKIENFYSDSLSDEPLSKLAKKSYIVKKNEIINWEEYKLTGFKKIKKLFFNRDFITFVFIGVINAFNGIWIAYVYSIFIKSPILAYVFGFLTSLTIAYILNSLLNFKEKLSFNKFTKYVLNNIPNFIIQILSVTILLDVLNFSKLLSYAISAVVAVPITFILVKVHVFK